MKGVPQESFIGTFLKCFNPIAYKNLANYRFDNVIKYFLSLLFLAFIAVVALSIPRFASYELALNDGLSKFDELNLTIGIETSEPIIISNSNPILIIDSTGEYKNLSTGKILITDLAVVKKPVICYFSGLLCKVLGKDEEQVTPMKNFEKMLKFKDVIINSVKLAIIILLPVILSVLFIAYVIKYLVIVLFFTLIGFLVAFFAKHEIAFTEIFKVSVFSSSTLITLDIISYTMADLSMLSISLYVIIFVIGLITAGIKEVKKPF